MTGRLRRLAKDIKLIGKEMGSYLKTKLLNFVEVLDRLYFACTSSQIFTLTCKSSCS